MVVVEKAEHAVCAFHRCSWCRAKPGHVDVEVNFCKRADLSAEPRKCQGQVFRFIYRDCADGSRAKHSSEQTRLRQRSSRHSHVNPHGTSVEEEVCPIWMLRSRSVDMQCHNSCRFLLAQATGSVLRVPTRPDVNAQPRNLREIRGRQRPNY